VLVNLLGLDIIVIHQGQDIRPDIGAVENGKIKRLIK
jgi:hypothetical protein